MVYLHKILPLFFLPTGITLVLVLGGLAIRRQALCWAGIGLLWIASTPLVSDEIMRAAEGWQTRQPLAIAPVAQAIVVLSTGRVQPPGDPAASEWLDADRFFGGVELYKSGKAPLLIFTGGWVPWRPDARPEGDVLMDYAAALGIPRNNMLSTGKVANTEEESRAVADLLAKRPGTNAAPRVLLVTSAYHMHRAQMLFARAGLDVLPFPVDFQVPEGKTFTLMDVLPRGESLNQSETALRELYGIAYYRLLRG